MSKWFGVFARSGSVSSVSDAHDAFRKIVRNRAYEDLLAGAKGGEVPPLRAFRPPPCDWAVFRGRRPTRSELAERQLHVALNAIRWHYGDDAHALVLAAIEADEP
jgi:hypothetical protein